MASVYEMTSSLPNRMIGDGFRRLGYGEEVTDYFDEHVEADAVHEQIAGRDLAGGLARLRSLGIRCLLVEGGSRVITSALREQLADRAVVAVAPILLGKGTDAVGDLGASLVRDGLRLLNRTVHQLEQDLVVAGDLDWAGG